MLKYHPSQSICHIELAKKCTIIGVPTFRLFFLISPNHRLGSMSQWEEPFRLLHCSLELLFSGRKVVKLETIIFGVAKVSTYQHVRCSSPVIILQAEPSGIQGFKTINLYDGSKSFSISFSLNGICTQFLLYA